MSPRSAASMARVIGIVTTCDRFLGWIANPFGFRAEQLDLFVPEAGPQWIDPRCSSFVARLPVSSSSSRAAQSSALSPSR